MSIPVLTPDQIQIKLQARTHPAQITYLAMYSTWWGGIVKDPTLMMIPIDDHIVHRGDGVFEALRVIDGKAFMLDDHLARLTLSAEQISLQLPMSIEEMKEIILQTAAASGSRSSVLRLYISRGPGGFTTNPYESIASQMYLVVTAFTPWSDERYRAGVKLGKSHIAPKEPWFARIKSCNYLPNVLMKKESIDRKIDFTVGMDAQGFMTESSTENVILVDKENNLVRPQLRQILKGTTMMRTFELAKSLVTNGDLNSIVERNISETEIKEAKEVMMIGTTLDVLPVTDYEGQKIGTGQQGPVAAKLLNLLREDMKTGPKATPVPY